MTSLDDWGGRRIERLAAKDGQQMCIRMLRPDDRLSVQVFFDSLSASSKYQRYFQHKDKLTDNELDQCLNPAVGQRFVLGIWVCEQNNEETALVGTASLVQLLDSEETAEFAIIIADDWQNKGIGSGLMSAVLQRARHAGVQRVLVYFLPANAGMKKLAESVEPDVTFKYDEGIVVASIALDTEEAVAVYWPGEMSEIWDQAFQSVIDLSLLPFSLYLDLEKENSTMLEELSGFQPMWALDAWLESLEDIGF